MRNLYPIVGYIHFADWWSVRVRNSLRSLHLNENEEGITSSSVYSLSLLVCFRLCNSFRSFLRNEIPFDFGSIPERMCFTWDSRWFHHVLRWLLCRYQVFVATVGYRPQYDRTTRRGEWRQRRETRTPTSTFSWWIVSKSFLSRNCLVRSSTRSPSPNNQSVNIAVVQAHSRCLRSFSIWQSRIVFSKVCTCNWCNCSKVRV